mmetsp:Transcript_8984/g.19265  ORF Transcript_8984/g.19265 Transcript_8984/m.19265 type:complete len:94 (+) Transcript_8984:324-605(+)
MHTATCQFSAALSSIQHANASGLPTTNGQRACCCKQAQNCHSRSFFKFKKCTQSAPGSTWYTMAHSLVYIHTSHFAKAPPVSTCIKTAYAMGA